MKRHTAFLLPALLAVVAHGDSSLRGHEHSGSRQLLNHALMSFRLIDSGTNQPIMDLRNGTVVALAALGLSAPRFNVEAVVSNIFGNTRSVKFEYNETIYRTESVVPYAFCGDINGKFAHCSVLGLGSHTITAIPFVQPRAAGTEGSPTSITFSIIHTAIPAPVPADEYLSAFVLNFINIFSISSGYRQKEY